MAVDIVELTQSVQISWTAPNDGSASLDEYEVQILSGSTTWVTVSACSTSSLSTAACSVSMLALWTSPYSLTYGTLIQARVKAHNSYGWASDYSDPNTSGVTVTAVPAQMSAPTIASYSNTRIIVTWTAVTSAPANGNSAILGYELFWNAGVSGAEPTTSLADTTLTSYTLTTVTEAATYKFAIRARNVYGSAASLSSTVAVTTVSTPG